MAPITWPPWFVGVRENSYPVTLLTTSIAVAWWSLSRSPGQWLGLVRQPLPAYGIFVCRLSHLSHGTLWRPMPKLLPVELGPLLQLPEFSFYVGVALGKKVGHQKLLTFWAFRVQISVLLLKPLWGVLKTEMDFSVCPGWPLGAFQTLLGLRLPYRGDQPGGRSWIWLKYNLWNYNSLEALDQVLSQIRLDMFHLFDEFCLHAFLPVPKLTCVHQEVNY